MDTVALVTQNSGENAKARARSAITRSRQMHMIWSPVALCCRDSTGKGSASGISWANAVEGIFWLAMETEKCLASSYQINRRYRLEQ